MKLKTRDQLHISSLGPDALAPGAEFDVPDTVGKNLVKRGLADAVEDDPAREPDAPAEKSEPEPLNKAEIAPANKAASRRKTKGN